VHLVAKHFDLEMHNGLLQSIVPWEGACGPLKALAAKASAVTVLARTIHLLPLHVPMESSVLLTKADLQSGEVVVEFVSVSRQFMVRVHATLCCFHVYPQQNPCQNLVRLPKLGGEVHCRFLNECGHEIRMIFSVL
jgi:hypothetical protein